ncbi:hypothetical protein BDV59DRAFT_45345 [Aspergillus ambiguus]|uniref:uncharacterized protein n=1 Tax=Aspergillus ambiguus TaxID=176160 RepID=UPI003CCD988E
MPPGNGRRGRQKDEIYFINARPSTDDERINIQRMVRAHVGRWISDQTKDRSASVSDPLPDDQSQPVGEKILDDSQPPELDTDENLFASSSPSHTSSPPSPESSNGLIPTRPLSRQTQSVIVPLQHEPPVKRLDGGSSWPGEDSDSSSDSAVPVTSGDYIESIGGSVLDPFHTYPARFSPEVVHACESYCLQVLWPHLTPSSASGSDDLATSNWFPLSLSDPTLFTAFLFGSLSHQRVQWVNRWIPEGAFRPRDQQLLQLVEFETIKMINREVRDPNRAISDTVILSVMCMAHNIADDNDQRRHRTTPFTAPMRRLQWLDVYGSLPPNLVHIQGLIQIIGLRGGLDNITLPGLAPVLCLSDIITASTYLTPPMFTFYPLCESRKKLSMHELLGYTPMEAEHRYGHLRQIGLTSELINVYHAMNVYTSIVNGHLQKSSLKLDEALLADQRNLVHYTVLSIPAASQIDGFTGYHGQGIIYETCRLAGLIFSVGVILPLPAQSTPLAQLATLIKGVFQIFHINPVWSHPQARITLLWVLMLGGIAAENSPERAWYVNTLRQVARENNVTTWPQLRAILGTILWWDIACDQPGQNLWSEVGRSFVR